MGGTHGGKIRAVDGVCRRMWRDVAARHMATAVFCNLFSRGKINCKPIGLQVEMHESACLALEVT